MREGLILDVVASYFGSRLILTTAVFIYIIADGSADVRKYILKLATANLTIASEIYLAVFFISRL